MWIGLLIGFHVFHSEIRTGGENIIEKSGSIVVVVSGFIVSQTSLFLKEFIQKYINIYGTK